MSSHKTSLGGYLISYRDITEQLRMDEELARQREIARQNEKLSALGELLAGVAHELNNPLSVVYGYAQMLKGRVDDPVAAERIELIRRAAKRSARIVKTFLAMARQRPTRIELCSLNDAVTTALEVSSYGLRSNGTAVETAFDETVPPVSGDFDQLVQVFSNLIVNAEHALKPRREQGKLTIRSWLDEDTDHVTVEVRDNGHGMPEDIRATASSNPSSRPRVWAREQVSASPSATALSKTMVARSKCVRARGAAPASLSGCVPRTTARFRQPADTNPFTRTGAPAS